MPRTVAVEGNFLAMKPSRKSVNPINRNNDSAYIGMDEGAMCVAIVSAAAVAEEVSIPAIASLEVCFV